MLYRVGLQPFAAIGCVGYVGMGMPTYSLNQAFAQPTSYPPWLWIPAVHAGMTAL